MLIAELAIVAARVRVEEQQEGTEERCTAEKQQIECLRGHRRPPSNAAESDMSAIQLTNPTKAVTGETEPAASS